MTSIYKLAKSGAQFVLLHAKVAGKLFVIGEYNVLKSGHRALVTPVKRYMYGCLKKQHDVTTISYKGRTIVYGETSDFPRNFTNTVATLDLFNEYLNQKNIPQVHFNYKINNKLSYKNKLKIGLGSSGASIALTLKLLNKLYNTQLTNEEMFKFSVLVQKKVGKLSSGADLAATIYDTPVVYTRYDTEWLEKAVLSLALLTQEWPLLQITPTNNVPRFVVGWTKETFKPELANPAPTTFYEQAEQVVNNFLKTNDKTLIKQYQTLLNELNEHKPGLLTKKLTQALTASTSLDIPAKISGAGYGDCVIAFITNAREKKLLKKAWAKDDIMLLDIWRK